MLTYCMHFLITTFSFNLLPCLPFLSAFSDSSSFPCGNQETRTFRESANAVQFLCFNIHCSVLLLLKKI